MTIGSMRKTALNVAMAGLLTAVAGGSAFAHGGDEGPGYGPWENMGPGMMENGWGPGAGMMGDWGGGSGAMHGWGPGYGSRYGWGGGPGAMYGWGPGAGMMGGWGGGPGAMHGWGPGAGMMPGWGGGPGAMHGWGPGYGGRYGWGGGPGAMQGWGPGPGAMYGWDGDSDDVRGLTPEQRQKVDDIMRDHYRKQERLRGEAAQKRGELEAQLSAQIPDPKAVGKAYEALSDVRTRMLQNRVEMRNQVRNAIGSDSDSGHMMKGMPGGNSNGD